MFDFLSGGKSDHRRVSEMLSAYVDGELSARERARVDRHLSECADCRWELETLRQTATLLGQLPSVPVPRSFAIREMDVSRRAAPSPPRRAYTLLRGATALAALLLAVVVAGDLFLHPAMRSVAPAMAPAQKMPAPTQVAQAPQPLAAPPTPTVVVARDMEKAAGESAADYGAAAPTRPPLPPTPTPEPAVSGMPAVEKAAEPPVAEATASLLPAAVPPGEEAPEPGPAPEGRQATQMPAVEPKAAPTATPPAPARPSPAATAERQPRRGEASGRGPWPGPLQLAEAGLCLLVVILAAATVVVGRRRRNE